MSFIKLYVLDRASGLTSAQLLSSQTSGTFTFAVSVANPIGTQSWDMPTGYKAVMTINNEQILLSALSITGTTVTATIETRGYNDTQAATHASSSVISIHVTKAIIDAIENYIAQFNESGLIVPASVTATPTITSASVHSVAGIDVTTVFTVGRAYAFKVAGVWYRGVVRSSSFSTNTTINISGDGLPASGTVQDFGLEFEGSVNAAIDYQLIKECSAVPANNAPSGYNWLFTKSGSWYTKDSSGNVRFLTKVRTTASSTGGVLSLDLSTANVFDVTLTENITSVVPTNGVNGNIYTIRIKQAAGLYTVVLGSSFRFNTTVPGYAANQVDGAFDYLNFSYNSDGSLYDIRSVTTGTQASITVGANSQTLVDTASIAWNLANGTFADVTLGGNRTLATPSGMSKQQLARLIVYQDNTAGRTLTFGGGYLFSAVPTLSANPLTADVFDFQSDGRVLLGLSQKTLGAATGYFAGGDTSGGNSVATTNGLNFFTDTVAQVTKGALAQAGRQGGAANSVYTGYFAGGITNSSNGGSLTCSGLSFYSDTVAQITKGALSVIHNQVGSANSPTVGYFSGGNTNNSYTATTVTDGLNFASDTTTQVTKGVLSTARAEMGSASSPTVGYFAGGSTSNGNAFSTVCFGLTFSTDTTTQVTKGALASTRANSGGHNSGTVGYFSGGFSGAGVGVSTTEGLTFASDTTAQVTKGALTTTMFRTVAVNSRSVGYMASQSTTNGLTYATDTTTMVTKGALTYVATAYFGGCQAATIGVQLA